MDKETTTQRPVDSPEINKAAYPDPHALGDAHPHPDRSLDEIVSALKAGSSVRDKLSFGGDEYEVETVMQANDREWYFLATVRHNGDEITDDIELAPDELRRKRATQANKSKALWNLFVKEAAATHLEKCRCVKRRLENVKKAHWQNKKYVLPVLGGLIAALAGTGIYMWQVTTPAAIPTAQKTPASPDKTEKPTLMIDVQSAQVPRNAQAPKPVATTAPAQPATPAARDDFARAENQPPAEPSRNQPAAQTQDGLSTPEIAVQTDDQAIIEPEPISQPQHPMPSATESDDLTNPAENQPPAEASRKQPAAQAQGGLPTPETAVQSSDPALKPEELVAKDRETPEALQQQAAPQLSREEIRQKVRKLLNNPK